MMRLKSLKNKVFFGFPVLLLFLLFFACHKDASPEVSPPSNADIAMALIAYESAGNCNIIPMTVQVTERGKREEDGSWPLTVHYTCIDKSSGGAEKFEKQMSIKLRRSQDSSGKTEWGVK